MTKRADLHIHTSFSDGIDAPERVVEIAVKRGLAAIAITDHDQVNGIAPAHAAAEGRGLEVIPGIELSTEHSGKDIHMLGYFVDVQNARLQEALATFQSVRVSRARQIVARLRQHGCDRVTFEDVEPLAETASIGRPHIAAVLIEKGYARDNTDAFERFIGEGCPCYVPKHKQSPFEAIDLIRSCGGAAVMAHPMRTQRDELIAAFAKAGMVGIEAWYSGSTPNETQFYERLAQKYGLIVTGGSDAHGYAYSLIGQVTVDYSVVEALRARAGVGHGG